MARCDAERELLPLHLALVFGYFGYLRISNLAPDTIAGFDPSRNTCWSDVLLAKEGIMLILRWSKTLQAESGSTPIPLPAIPDSQLCPVLAWERYVGALPMVREPSSTPLLLAVGIQSGKPIISHKLRAMFHRMVCHVGLGEAGHTPHSLRRGGATDSLALGVPLQHIKTQGTWPSSAVERYLIKTPIFTTPVATAFKKSFSN